MDRRFTAPLGRGMFEELIVVVASVAGAVAAVLYADGLAAAFGGGPRNAIQGGEVLLVFIAPAPLGAIPWAIGELLAGESKRQRMALYASIAVAYVLSVAVFALVGPQAFWAPSPSAFLIQLGSVAIAGLGAAEAYLMIRGEALEPPPPEAVALVRMLDDCRAPSP